MRTPPAERSARAAEACILLLALLMCLAGLRTVVLGDNAASRLATAWSLVHAGTWFIDEPAPDGRANPFNPLTVDRVEIDGRMISTKPPLLPLAITALYAAAHAGAGLRLDDPAHLKPLVQGITFATSVVPCLIALVLVALVSRWIMPDPRARPAVVAAAAFATMLPGFAPHINNHVPGTAAMLGCLACCVGVATGRWQPRPGTVAAAGALGGLTFAVDLPLTIFAAFALSALFAAQPRAALAWALPAGMAVVGLHAGILYWVTGSPLPVQMQKSLYFYESAYWRNPGGMDALNEPKGLYAFHMLLGRHGTFLLFPVLLLGIAAPFRPAIDPSWRPWQWGGLAAFGVLTAYYVLQTNNYGGAAYGFRWHLGAMPVLLLVAAPWCATWRRAQWIAAIPLVLVSLYSAWECRRAPWSVDQEWAVRWIFGPTI